MNLEVIRLMIPQNMMIGDNSKQYWKTHMQKLQFLSNLTRNSIEGLIEMPGNFKIPNKEEICKITNQNKNFKLIFEIWRYKNIEFDLYNYSKTSKAIIDVLTNKGYWKDDSWKYIAPVIINGGGKNNWHLKLNTYNSIDLPDNSNDLEKWWKNNDLDMKSTFVRIIISDNTNI